ITSRVRPGMTTNSGQLPPASKPVNWTISANAPSTTRTTPSATLVPARPPAVAGVAKAGGRGWYAGGGVVVAIGAAGSAAGASDVVAVGASAVTAAASSSGAGDSAGASSAPIAAGSASAAGRPLPRPESAR